MFCKIVRKEVAAKIVLDEQDILAFYDSNPQAPVHVLVIPKQHVVDLDSMGAERGALGGTLLRACSRVAGMLALGGTGYRVVANNGAGAGQSVFHLHFHVLGGRQLGWPPG